MTRRVFTDKDEDDKNYVTIVTGGPMKYHNRRRVRKVFADKLTLFKFEPINSVWFQDIIKEIAPARHRLRLTQKVLASLVGTTHSEISRLELGKTNPTAESLDRLFSVLNLSVEIKIHPK